MTILCGEISAFMETFFFVYFHKVDIFHKVDDASKRYDMEGNYVAGANIAGFEKVVDAMIAQGIV